MGFWSSLVALFSGKPTTKLAIQIPTFEMRMPETKPSRGTLCMPDDNPPGRCVFRDVMVAGISYKQRTASDFIDNGTNRALELQAEPDNPKDRNALKVMAVWNGRREHIGYVPKEIARQIAKEYSGLPIAPMIIKVFPSDPEHETPGIRYDIFIEVPTKPRKTATKRKARVKKAVVD